MTVIMHVQWDSFAHTNIYLKELTKCLGTGMACPEEIDRQ